MASRWSVSGGWVCFNDDFCNSVISIGFATIGTGTPETKEILEENILFMNKYILSKLMLHTHAGDCRRYKIKLGNKIDN